MPEKSGGCVQPSRGPLGGEERVTTAAELPRPKEERTVQARVGAPAPDFEAAAFVNGDFKNIKLSDYRGRWVALCFFPGDFTFV